MALYKDKMCQMGLDYKKGWNWKNQEEDKSYTVVWLKEHCHLPDT
jgi:hypothetical protein